MKGAAAGFTLLEVMVALFIVALLAVSVSQVVGQRMSIAATVVERDFAALCARELMARFALEGIAGERGELQQGGGTCYWSLQRAQDDGAGLGIRTLRLFAQRDERQLLGAWPLLPVRNR